MPNAVAHILIPMILVDIIMVYGYKNKKYFNTNHILICGIAGIIPDIDVAFGLIMTAVNGTSPYLFHRTITHSIFIPLIILLASAILHRTGNKEHFKIAIMIFIGYSLHLLLDYMLIESIMPFYPLSTEEYGLNIIRADSTGTALMLGLDTIILLAWLIHEQLKHKIRDYI